MVQVRNGRLAMLANLGFWSQAATTGKAPLQNLQDHIADPGHVNSESFLEPEATGPEKSVEAWTWSFPHLPPASTPPKHKALDVLARVEDAIGDLCWQAKIEPSLVCLQFTPTPRLAWRPPLPPSSSELCPSSWRSGRTSPLRTGGRRMPHSARSPFFRAPSGGTCALKLRDLVLASWCKRQQPKGHFAGNF